VSAHPARRGTATVRAALLEWYAAEHRDFPWRGATDAYAVLVSEVMLQQTQASRVVERFERFMARFPSATALADATPAAVLAEWSGLGYNRRALALQRAAAAVARDGWPRDVAALSALPGVGPYTARAIASLAFGVQVGVVDTNVRRWLVRRFGLADAPRSLQAQADRLAAAGVGPEVAAWTHASMEFGARVCRARDPRCDACPIARGCPSRGSASAVPVPRQGSLRGSTRAYRGAVVRTLSASRGHRIAERALRARLASAAGRIGPELDGSGWERVLAGLERDGLVHRSAGVVALGRRYNPGMSIRLAVGDPLPSVGLRATDGYLLNLRSHVTKQPVVLLFFGAPTLAGAGRRRGLKAIEALSAGYQRLRQAGIDVAAVSCDSEQQQHDFAAKQSIPFLLLSDERRSAVEMLGIETVADGANVNVVRPVAIAADRDGIVRAVIERVEPDALVDLVVRALSEPIPAAATGS